MNWRAANSAVKRPANHSHPRWCQWNLFARLAGGTLKDGKLSFPFHIGGTVDNPIFSKGSEGQKVK